MRRTITSVHSDERCETITPTNNTGAKAITHTMRKTASRTSVVLTDANVSPAVLAMHRAAFNTNQASTAAQSKIE